MSKNVFEETVDHYRTLHHRNCSVIQDEGWEKHRQCPDLLAPVERRPLDPKSSTNRQKVYRRRHFGRKHRIRSKNEQIRFDSMKNDEFVSPILLCLDRVL